MSTTLRLCDVYADRLHAALVAQPVETLADLWHHPAVAGFARPTTERVVAELVDRGALRLLPQPDGTTSLHIVPDAAVPK